MTIKRRIHLLKMRSGLIWSTVCLLALIGAAHGQTPPLEATPVIGPKLLLEASPTVAIADRELTQKIGKYLKKTTEGSWTPSRETALAAVARIQSDRGRRDIIAKASPALHIGTSLNRIARSRFQIFGLVIAGRKELLIDATPLQSDAPELWLTGCISCSIFDGGAAYWWVLVDADSLEVTSCGRRP
jgi:hypothetical protein